MNSYGIMLCGGRDMLRRSGTREGEGAKNGKIGDRQHFTDFHQEKIMVL